jgi:hypothetical protein
VKLAKRSSRDAPADEEPPARPDDDSGDRRPGLRGLRSVPGLLGVALVVIGAGLALSASGFERGASARVVGVNAPINAGARVAGDISAHNSPSLVSNPRNRANLVIANKIDSPRFSCALHVSFDGGVQWSQTPIPVPAGEEPKCYAPDAVFAADGTLHMSFVTLKGRGNVPNAVWLVSSRDGGRTLSDPERVRGRLKFQVRLAADPAAPRRLYMTWLDAPHVGLFKFTRTGNPIRASRSDDGGATWSAPVGVNSPSRVRAVAPSPAVGPGGQLYVLYLDLGDDRLDYEGGHGGRGGEPYSGRWKLVLAGSEDRGETWGESVVEQQLVPSERFIAFTPPFPSLAVDRRAGTVYAGFHDSRRGDPDAYVWKLRRGSDTWSRAKRVNDTPSSNDSSQLLPKLSVAPDGRLDVAYLDRRADPADRMTEVSLQASYDGAKSFLPRLRVSDRRFDSRIGYGSERRMPDLGSRLGLMSTSARALVVWADTRAGTPASGKQDLARGLAAFSPPEELPGSAKVVLYVGGLLLALAGIGLIFHAVARRGRTSGAPREPRRVLPGSLTTRRGASER